MESLGNPRPKLADAPATAERPGEGRHGNDGE